LELTFGNRLQLPDVARVGILVVLVLERLGVAATRRFSGSLAG
jgi:hypothetical protein